MCVCVSHAPFLRRARARIASQHWGRPSAPSVRNAYAYTPPRRLACSRCVRTRTHTHAHGERVRGEGPNMDPRGFPRIFLEPQKNKYAPGMVPRMSQMACASSIASTCNCTVHHLQRGQCGFSRRRDAVPGGCASRCLE